MRRYMQSHTVEDPLYDGLRAARTSMHEPSDVTASVWAARSWPAARPPSSCAAVAVIEQGFKGAELLDLAERVAALEGRVKTPRT